MRRVNCPHCAHRFEVSVKAISLRCPACTRHLRFEDVVIRHRLKGELATMGHVRLENPSEVIGRVVCGGFVNHGGRFEGSVTVFGDIELTPQSFTAGQLVAKSLHVRIGATVRAKATIVPRPQEPPKPATLPRIKRPVFRI
jgi:cytoskeletal protein CcmA (bactofilin family)